MTIDQSAARVSVTGAAQRRRQSVGLVTRRVAAREPGLEMLVSGQTRPRPSIDVVVPVYNEAQVLGQSISRLDGWLAGWEAEGGPSTRITIADNASSDGTWRQARRLAEGRDRVLAVHLDRKGRGRALREVWSASDAEVLAYMDVDLSTGLNALPGLVAPLLSGHSQVGVGSRLDRRSRTTRGSRRNVISRAYNLILRVAARAHFSDAQCGFKAIRGDAAAQLLPLVADDGWFFDTELLLLAERAGLRIAEIPVDWTDDPDHRVDVMHTAMEDLKGPRVLIRSATGCRRGRA